MDAIKATIKNTNVINVHYKNCIMIKTLTKIARFEDLTSRQLYHLLLNMENTPPKSQLKYSQHFDIHNCTEQWERIYILPHQTIKCNDALPF